MQNEKFKIKNVRSAALAILHFAFCIFNCSAAFTPTNEVDGLVDESSYGTYPYVLSERYFASYFDDMYPQWTNHIFDISESGSAWQFDWQNNWEKWGLAHMANFPVPFSVFVLANDNGGYVSNDVVEWGTNMAAAPPLFYNGTAVTNEGVSCPAATYYFTGGILADSADQTATISRNAGCLYLNGLYGTPQFDLYHELSTNGWLADQSGPRLLGFYPGGHPYPPGHLCMAIWTLINLGVETNVASVTLDYNAVTATTNHCVVSGLAQANGGLSGTIHYDRMPMGWDVPDGTITNDARNAFVVMPALANAFRWMFTVTNLPAGTYNILMDGVLVDTATSADLATGRNWFTNYNGWLGAQRRAVQNSICDEYGVDHVTLIAHSAGQGGVHGVADLVNWISNANNFYDTLGQRGSTLVTSMASDVGAMNTNAYYTWVTAQQTNHTFAVMPIGLREAPFFR